MQGISHQLPSLCRIFFRRPVQVAARVSPVNLAMFLPGKPTSFSDVTSQPAIAWTFNGCFSLCWVYLPSICPGLRQASGRLSLMSPVSTLSTGSSLAGHCKNTNMSPQRDRGVGGLRLLPLWEDSSCCAVRRYSTDIPCCCLSRGQGCVGLVSQDTTISNFFAPRKEGR